MSIEPDQASRWRDAGLRHGVEVIAPCTIRLRDGTEVQATALVKVGPINGMVIDPEWRVLEPHAAQLVAEGYGYSVVEIGGDDLTEMLRDWRGGG